MIKWADTTIIRIKFGDAYSIYRVMGGAERTLPVDIPLSSCDGTIVRESVHDGTFIYVNNLISIAITAAFQCDVREAGRLTVRADGENNNNNKRRTSLNGYFDRFSKRLEICCL